MKEQERCRVGGRKRKGGEGIRGYMRKGEAVDGINSSRVPWHYAAITKVLYMGEGSWGVWSAVDLKIA